MLATIISSIVALIGFIFIFTRWRSNAGDAQQSEKAPCLIIGWGCIATACVLMVLQAGAEFGPAYALFGFAAFPLALAAYNFQARSANNVKSKPEAALSLSPKKSASNVLHFLAAIPLAMICSLLCSMVVADALAESPVSAMTIMVFAFPAIWAVLAFLYLYVERRLIFAVVMAITSAAIALISFA